MTEMAGAADLIGRLRDTVDAMPRLVADGRSSRLVLRAGLASVGSDALNLGEGDDLLDRASTALRYAHSSQASRVRTFDEVPSTFV